MLTLRDFELVVDKMWAPNDPFKAQEPIARIVQQYYNKYRVAEAVKPKRIVELGVRAGYSAHAFGLASHADSYTGYDAYELMPHLKIPSWYRTHAHQLIDKLYRSVEIRTCDISVMTEVPEADLYHVDAGHSTKDVYHDLSLASQRAPEHAVILVDDVQYSRIYDGIMLWATNNLFLGIFVADLRGELLLFKRQDLLEAAAVQFPDGLVVSQPSQLPKPLAY